LVVGIPLARRTSSSIRALQQQGGSRARRYQVISLETVVWTAGLIGLGAVALVVFARLHAIWNLRLMRCPETGSIALVDTARVARAGEAASTVTVRSCDLWPERKCCARGCLERYEETAPGGRIRVAALRPFAPGARGEAVRRPVAPGMHAE
jgi:hypothetical protein